MVCDGKRVNAVEGTLKLSSVLARRRPVQRTGRRRCSTGSRGSHRALGDQCETFEAKPVLGSQVRTGCEAPKFGVAFLKSDIGAILRTELSELRTGLEQSHDSRFGDPSIGCRPSKPVNDGRPMTTIAAIRSPHSTPCRSSSTANGHTFKGPLTAIGWKLWAKIGKASGRARIDISG